MGSLLSESPVLRTAPHLELHDIRLDAGQALLVTRVIRVGPDAGEHRPHPVWAVGSAPARTDSLAGVTAPCGRARRSLSFCNTRFSSYLDFIRLFIGEDFAGVASMCLQNARNLDRADLQWFSREQQLIGTRALIFAPQCKRGLLEYGRDAVHVLLMTKLAQHNCLQQSSALLTRPRHQKRHESLDCCLKAAPCGASNALSTAGET